MHVYVTINGERVARLAICAELPPSLGGNHSSNGFGKIFVYNADNNIYLNLVCILHLTIFTTPLKYVLKNDVYYDIQ